MEEELSRRENELSEASDAPQSPAPAGGALDGRKRKRDADPGTPNDDDEIARRRRLRRSLAFQQRRRSLTLTKAPKPAQSRQYISDMYSTIIKMSSENKINVKNSWSLHLIDHMEDILETPQNKDGESDENPDGTYNFQKASCTLDASIKIYSYRVDDTWNSSYKILENLSRTETKHGSDEPADEGGATAKKPRKSGAAARTIEKNLNNINLKTYDMEFEADPLFHKMSQSFDEGGAKGMLLANLSVYEGCKILLNSADVKMSTRKSDVADPIPAEPEKVAEETDPVKNEIVEDRPVSDRISLSCFGNLSCLSQDTQDLEVCPPLKRLYNQIEDYYGDEARLKLGVKNEFLLMTPVKGRRQAAEQTDKITINLAGIMEDAAEDDSDDGNDGVDFFDGNDGAEGDEEMPDASAEVVDERTETEDDSSVDGPTEAGATDAAEPDISSEEKPDAEPTPEDKDDADAKGVSATAADFFRSRVTEASRTEEANELSHMIESAMVRSASLADEIGEDLDGINDYSYFDLKMLRNWAGPVHWKFPAVRKFQMKNRAEKQENNTGADATSLDSGEGNEDAKGEQNEPTKKSGVDKKAVLVDFFADPPDLDKLLKPAKSPASLVVSKQIASRQDKKSSELVLPVDTHIEIGLFFQRFLKPKLKYFKRATTESSSRNEFNPAGIGADMHNADDGDRSFGESYSDLGGFDGGYDDDNESAVSTTHVEEVSYSTAGLVTAERVVEKIDVHYERVAKRVDVKKLKSSIWTHLEKDVNVTPSKTAEEKAANPAAAAKNESGKRPREEDADDEEEAVELDTTFENVVESVSGKVPPNVTVSFYFICMLHLANEKGLKLTGQDDLRNFQIKKD